MGREVLGNERYSAEKKGNMAPTLLTLQERLFHGLHESLQVVLDVVHHDVNPVHVATDNQLLVP